MNMTPRVVPSIQAVRDAHPDIGYGDGPECFACGVEGGPEGMPLKRAHIVARYNDGGDEPSNFFLLCPPCYGEQNAYDNMPEWWQWAWLRSHESSADKHFRIAKAAGMWP